MCQIYVNLKLNRQKALFVEYYKPKPGGVRKFTTH